MFTIRLERLSFFAFHGLYPEERILGNQYEVNAEISIDATEPVIHFNQTIDYVKLYSIIKECMQVATPLLETLAEHIAEEIHAHYDKSRTISIRVTKLHPPIPHFTGAVSVCYKKEFHS